MTTDSSADVRVTAPFLNYDKHFIFTKHITVPLGVTVAHTSNDTQFKGTSNILFLNSLSFIIMKNKEKYFGNNT